MQQAYFGVMQTEGKVTQSQKNKEGLQPIATPRTKQVIQTSEESSDDRDSEFSPVQKKKKEKKTKAKPKANSNGAKSIQKSPQKSPQGQKNKNTTNVKKQSESQSSNENTSSEPPSSQSSQQTESKNVQAPLPQKQKQHNPEPKASKQPSSSEDSDSESSFTPEAKTNKATNKKDQPKAKNKAKASKTPQVSKKKEDKSQLAKKVPETSIKITQQKSKAQPKRKNSEAKEREDSHSIDQSDGLRSSLRSRRKKVNYNDQYNEEEIPAEKVPYRRKGQPITEYSQNQENHPAEARTKQTKSKKSQGKSKEKGKQMDQKKEKQMKAEGSIIQQKNSQSPAQSNYNHTNQDNTDNKKDELENNPMVRSLSVYQSNVNKCARKLQITPKVVVESVFILNAHNPINVITTDQLQQQFKLFRESFQHAPCCPYSEQFVGKVQKKRIVEDVVSEDEETNYKKPKISEQKNANVIVQNNLNQDNSEQDKNANKKDVKHKPEQAQTTDQKVRTRRSHRKSKKSK